MRKGSSIRLICPARHCFRCGEYMDKMDTRSVAKKVLCARCVDVSFNQTRSLTGVYLNGRIGTWSK